MLKAEIEDGYFKVVREGMRQVCTEGTAASTFSDFGIAVAGKTGTAENADHSDNLTFIGFAPYENPEIAWRSSSNTVARAMPQKRRQRRF